MNPNRINFCPNCGAKAFSSQSIKEYRCEACAYRLFHNTAAAVAGVIIVGSEVLLAQRGREPAQGLYDFPGGFVDPDESLETALIRELQEELSLTPSLSQLEYAFSDFNTYHYAGVSYKTTDVFFVIRLETKPQLRVSDDVAAVQWFDIHTIAPETLAFDGIRRAITRLQSAGTP